MNKISFVCVNYSHYDYTSHWVNSILNMYNIDKILNEIVIVNNSESRDEQSNLLKYLSRIEKVHIIETKNQGYFAGLNIGIAYLNDKYSDQDIIISNNDILFDKFFIDNYQQKIYMNEYLVIVPDIVTLDNIHQNPQYVNHLSRIRITLYKFYYSHYYIACLINILQKFLKVKQKKNMNYLVSQEIHLCTGACMILRNEFLIKNKLLDSRVFMWGEEALLSHQVEQSSGKIFYDKDLKVLHFEHGTVNKLSKRKSYEMVRQSFKIYKEYL